MELPLVKAVTGVKAGNVKVKLGFIMDKVDQEEEKKIKEMERVEKEQ